NSVIDKNPLSVEVNGSCPQGMILKIKATDSAKQATIPVWTQCQPWGYSGQVDISGLKDGQIKILTIQNANRRPQSATTYIVKNAGAVVAPTPVPVVATPTPVPATPTPTPTPTPAPVVSAPVTSSGLIYGVNGHDG